MNNNEKWFAKMLSFAQEIKAKLIGSVVLSVISLSGGLVPYYCMYKIIGGFISDSADNSFVLHWCIIALAAFAVKVLCFGLSTGLSHSAAYEVLEGLRKRVADRFMHAPLGTVRDISFCL